METEALPLFLNLWTKIRRYHAVVAYDGTDFCGFAAQTGRRTVQGTLTETVRRITGEVNEIIGASRTDSGAHAEGQSIHFDSSANVPLDKWQNVLNRALPEDVRIVSVRVAEPDFHARFSTEYRGYQYRVLLNNRDPFRARYCFLAGKRKFDKAAMEEAANQLIGIHDFKLLTQELDPSIQNTVRQLHKVELNWTEDEIQMNIDGNAFLRGMMRRISGLLLEIGRGHKSLESVPLLLDPNCKLVKPPVVLPAKGLCLKKVVYANPPQDCRTRSDGFLSSEDAE